MRHLFGTRGGEPLWEGLRADLAAASALSWVTPRAWPQGVSLVEDHLEDLLLAGGAAECFLGGTPYDASPRALRRLLDLAARFPGRLSLLALDGEGGELRAQALLLRDRDGLRCAYLGAELTGAALNTAQTWALRVEAPAALQQLDAAFDDLRPRAIPVTWALLDALPPNDDEAEPDPEPWDLQQEALDALASARQQGRRAALVVMATGLGKTWVAAFDAARAGARRVLFIAHREELLLQAARIFRRVFPDASLGFLNAQHKRRDVDLLMASVHTLARPEQLALIDPRDFDYVVVDEFHHAAAQTWRRALEHLQPDFLLGLTATPARLDGQPILDLCGGHLAFRASIWEGVRRGLLAPLRYLGVPDEIDYRLVRWQHGAFDEHDLEREALREVRLAAALRHLRAHSQGRALLFCVSQAHADALAAYLQRHGLRAASVHSGPSSAPRRAALDALQRGDLEALCAVDLLNEGVDLPAVDTVLLLRPTASPVVWLQQLGRGLRRAEGKDCLTVIDPIGNHRVFLDRPSWLFDPDEQDRQGVIGAVDVLRVALQGRLQLPPGCALDFDPVVREDLLRLLAESFPPPPPPRTGPPAPGERCAREEIATRFGYAFSAGGFWANGVVMPRRDGHVSDVFLFVTLNKEGFAEEFQYADRFLAVDRFQWQSQNRSARDAPTSRIFREHAEMNATIHLCVRHAKKDRGGSVPFVYCGPVDFVAWSGDNPITVQWRLRQPASPETLRLLQCELTTPPLPTPMPPPSDGEERALEQLRRFGTLTEEELIRFVGSRAARRFGGWLEARRVAYRVEVTGEGKRYLLASG